MVPYYNIATTSLALFSEKITPPPNRRRRRRLAFILASINLRFTTRTAPHVSVATRLEGVREAWLKRAADERREPARDVTERMLAFQRECEARAAAQASSPLYCTSAVAALMLAAEA